MAEPVIAASATANPNASEDRFQSLWDAGAFNPDGKPDPAQGQAVPKPVAAPIEAEPPAEPEAAAPIEAEGPEYVNVEDYLGKVGIEPASFYDLPVTVKVDGKSSQVKLAEVLKSYQLEQHVQAKSIAASEAQKAWDAQRTEQANAIKAQLEQAQTLGNLAHQQLLGEYQAIDWNQLRATDPARWAVLNTEFRQRADGIQAHLQQVQQQQQQQAQLSQQERAKALPLQRERMLEARPEWRDETQFQTARTEMLSYAQKQGFSQAELDGIYDYRSMLILHDAARWAALQAKAPQAANRVRAAPQVASPGARTQRDPQQAARSQAKERFMKNPRDPTAQERYFDTLA